MKEAKPDAWMPLYIGEWGGDTGHLSCEEDGAYMRLVRHYSRMGQPADNDASLARIVGMDLRAWKTVRPAIVGYFQSVRSIITAFPRAALLHHARVRAATPNAAQPYS